MLKKLAMASMNAGYRRRDSREDNAGPGTVEFSTPSVVTQTLLPRK